MSELCKWQMFAAKLAKCTCNTHTHAYTHVQTYLHILWRKCGNYDVTSKNFIAPSLYVLKQYTRKHKENLGKCNKHERFTFKMGGNFVHIKKWHMII